MQLIRDIRIVTAAVLVICALLCGSLLWATDNAPAPTGDQKKAREECQRVFDKELDDCLKSTQADPRPAGANDCIHIASERWRLCLQNHGLDPAQQRPPRTPPHRPGKQVDGTSVTKGDLSRTPTATPGKRGIDTGAKPARSPSATPLGTPKTVPKTLKSPSPKKG